MVSKLKFGAIAFTGYLIAGQCLAMKFDILATIKLVVNILILIIAMEKPWSEDGPRLLVSYVLGVVVSSLIALFGSLYFQEFFNTEKCEILKPYFIKEANTLFNYLKSLSIEELKKIWKCNDSIASQNYGRLQIKSMEQNTTPAIFSYDGIQYKYMSPDTMDENALNYIQENLFILSGLYGAVKPFDAVTPYRLEMQSKFQNWDYLNLYKFWGSKIAEYNLEKSDYVLNINTGKMGWLDQKNLEKCFNHGYESVMKNIEIIKKVIQ